MWRCPKCGGFDLSLQVAVCGSLEYTERGIRLVLRPDDNDQPGYDDFMSCGFCEYYAKCKDFEVGNTPRVMVVTDDDQRLAKQLTEAFHHRDQAAFASAGDNVADVCFRDDDYVNIPYRRDRIRHLEWGDEHWETFEEDLEDDKKREQNRTEETKTKETVEETGAV